MVDNKVGATGGGEPIRKGILTEYQVQESVKKKETIDANPTQEAPDDGVTAYTPEQAEALLNKNFYSDMGIDFASVKLDKEGKVIKPSEQREAKETLDVMFPEVQKEAELNNAQRSTNVTDLRREAREKYRNMLEVVLPSIDIEHIKGWFDGTKALPGTSNDKIDTKYAEMQESSKDIAATKEKSFYGDDAVSLEMVKATKQIDDKILKGLVIDSDFTDAQKDKIKEGIDKAHAMSLKDLAKEFGYEFDTNDLKNLDKEGNSTREDVQTQVDALKKLLDSIPNETKLNERIKGVTDNINTKHNDAKADKSLNRAYNLTSIKYGELDEEREFDDTELTQLQESDVEDYVTLQKLVLLKEAIVPLREQVQAAYDKFNTGNEELKQEEAYEENSVTVSTDLKESERNGYRGNVKDVRDSGTKTEKAANKTNKAEHKDKKKGEFQAKIDPKTGQKVSTRTETYNARREDEHVAKDAKTEAGYYKNFGHVNQYIYDKMKNKDISIKDGQELRAMLGEFALGDANKLELLADYVKVDDQSGEDMETKAKTKVSIETDLNQVKPDELKFLMKTIKDMDVEIKTTKQKNIVKKNLKENLDKYRSDAIAHCQTLEELNAWYADHEKDIMGIDNTDPNNPKAVVTNQKLHDAYNAKKQELEGKKDPK